MQIRTLESARLAEAAGVIAEAFRDEPIIGRMIELGASGRDRRIIDYFVWSIRSTGLANTDVAIDPLADRVVGVALWEPPGHAPRRVRGALAMPRALRGIGRRGFAVLNEFGAASDGKHPTQPHWHLVDVGASPSARGLGVGTALIKHRLSQADAARQLVSLEATTDASAQLYERLGFERKSELQGVAGGVTVMWREPVPQHSAPYAIEKGPDRG